MTELTESTDVKGIAPLVEPESAAFWANAAEGRLVVDFCNTCETYLFPPRRWCHRCSRSDTIDPTHELVAPAYLYSYTVNHVAWYPGMTVPFVVGLAQFDGVPDVRIPCRVRTGDLDALRIGARLEVGFESGPEGHAIPSFRLVP